MSAIFSKIFQSSTKGKESASVKLPSEIQNIDQNADGVVDKDELQVYIDQNAQLWAMLSVNCNIPESQCREIARDTARTMAKLNTLGKFATFQDLTPLNAAREPTVEEFAAFHQRLKQEPQYQLEFFHQTVFCAYDHDHNGFIEGEEINDFIDLFYEANGCFAGDARLPPKDHLKSAVLETFDTNGDGKLEFHELRPLISGGASGFTKDLGPSAEWPETKPTQDETEKEIVETETTKPKSKSKAPSSSSSSAITSNPQDGDHAASKTTTSKATTTATTTTTTSSSSSAKKKALKKDKSERKLKKKEKSERKLRKEGSDPKVVKRTHSSSDSNSKLKGKVKSDSKMKRDGSDPKIKPRDNDATNTATTKRKGTTEKSSKHKSTSSDNKPHASSSSTTPSSDTPKKSLKSHKKSSSSRNRSPSKTRSRSQSKTRSQSQTPRLRSQSRTRSKSRPSRRRASLKD